MLSTRTIYQSSQVSVLEDDFTRIDPEGIIGGENGKIWVQGRVVGGLVVAGESACVELQVKNHSAKKVGYYSCKAKKHSTTHASVDDGTADLANAQSSSRKHATIRESCPADF